MARETCPVMLMIASSPAPDSASSVTREWRLEGSSPSIRSEWIVDYSGAIHSDV
jgi:hypothetical protein